MNLPNAFGKFSRSSILLRKENSAIVYVGENTETEQPVAIKINNVTPFVTSREIEILPLLSKYNHPNILQCYHYEIIGNNTIVITEKCDSDLNEYFISKKKKLKESEVKIIAQQLGLKN